MPNPPNYSPADIMTGIEWWNGLTHKQRMTVLMQASDHKHDPSVADAWMLWRAGVIETGDHEERCPVWEIRILRKALATARDQMDAQSRMVAAMVATLRRRASVWEDIPEGENVAFELKAVSDMLEEAVRPTVPPNDQAH